LPSGNDDDSSGEGDSNSTAPLLASQNSLFFSDYFIDDSRAVRQDRLPEESISHQRGKVEINGAPQINIGQINPSQICAIEVDISKSNVTQIGTSQISFGQININQIGIAQVDTTQVGASQISFPQIDSTKISLTSSITLQQFLSSHNFSLQNTTIPAWTEFLTGTTPFNLNIEITDLPTGQLAVCAALLNCHRAVKEGRYQLE
jgi:hypothetical protein